MSCSGAGAHVNIDTATGGGLGAGCSTACPGWFSFNTIAAAA